MTFDGELKLEQTHKKILLVVDNGRRYQVSHYNKEDKFIDQIYSVDSKGGKLMSPKEAKAQLNTLLTEARIDELEKQIAVSRFKPKVDHRSWTVFCDQLLNRIQSLKGDGK